MNPDVINGLFEMAGSCLIWLNVRQLLRDRCVRGVHWGPPVFFTTWGYWNTFYYPALSQWWSMVGGISMAVANTAWVSLACRYRKG